MIWFQLMAGSVDGVGVAARGNVPIGGSIVCTPQCCKVDSKAGTGEAEGVSNLLLYRDVPNHSMI
jgi:hypothetical protein